MRHYTRSDDNYFDMYDDNDSGSVYQGDTFCEL